MKTLSKTAEQFYNDTYIPPNVVWQKSDVIEFAERYASQFREPSSPTVEEDLDKMFKEWTEGDKESETGEQEDQDDLWDAFGNEVNKWKHPEDGIGFHCLTNHLKKNWTLTRKPLDR